MAGHAKLVAIYETPFWRRVGLSGDGISHRGPLGEIHDASPQSEVTGALFGFVGIPAPERWSRSVNIIGESLAQLTAMFGPEAASPVDVLFQDWSKELHTATAQDIDVTQLHPIYGELGSAGVLWGGRAAFASTEAAMTFGGYLEGALEASEAALTVVAPECRRLFEAC